MTLTRAGRSNPALMATLGSTEAEAQPRARRLEELASPDFRWQNVLYTAARARPGRTLRDHLGLARPPGRR